MAPPYYDSCDYGGSNGMPVASNWQSSMLRDICNQGCAPSERPVRRMGPPFQAPACSAPCCIPTTPSALYAPYAPPRSCGWDPEPSPPPPVTCHLPPINRYASSSNTNQRPNCCEDLYPQDDDQDDCCPSPVPRRDVCCPEAPPNCVERVRPVKKTDNYEPPSQPFDGCSLYRTQFRGCFGPPAARYKPEPFFEPPSVPMSGLSLYREQFTCKPLGPIERPSKKEEYTPSCTPFDGCSTYRVDYRGNCGAPAKSLKPPSSFDQISGKMSGCSTYRSEFIPYCVAPYQRAKPQEAPYLGCSPFEGCSTYRVDYAPKCSQKTPSMKPTDRTGFSSAPFCARSTYRNDYHPFCFSDCCPEPTSTACCPPPHPCHRSSC